MNKKNGYKEKPGNILGRYFREIGEIDLLSVEKEVELGRKKNGKSEQDIKKLVKGNLRFGVSVAKEYQNKGLSLEDLINEGNIGLIEAAKKFDSTRGNKFISYAVWLIRRMILKSLSENIRGIRIPLNRVGQLKNIKKVSEDMELVLKREPKMEELAEVVDISELEINEILQKSQKSFSLDASFPRDEEGTLLDVIKNKEREEPDETVMQESLQQELKIALEALTPAEAEVLKLFFGLNVEDPLTLTEIGTKFSLTTERIRQIKEKALVKLRNSPRKKVLIEFLG